MARSKVSGKFRNRLLAALAPDDLALLDPHLTTVELEFRKQLESPNKIIQDAYFIEHGVASVVAGNSAKGEVGLVGYEGISSHAAVLGADRSPHATYMQVGGVGQRIGIDHLQNAMARSPAIQDVLLRYMHAFMIQISYSAVANMNASVEQRLSRWLLMVHDRVDDDELMLTHELLSLIVGTRRPGVTVAMQSLERQNLVKTRRGLIIVVDREGLEAHAGHFYGVAEAEYDRMTELSAKDPTPAQPLSALTLLQS